jgi:uroporphyrinogen-III synthase
MRVIVTRPEREALSWLAALSRRGVEALALPLIRIAPVSDPAEVRAAWQRVDDYAALMFVSGAAVDQFFAARQSSHRDLGPPLPARPRLWATGPGTVAALLRQGVDPARIDAPPGDSRQFDSEALWRVVQADVRAGDRVLIVRGDDESPGATVAAADAPGAGRDWLARRLVQEGARVEFVLAYRRCAPVLSPAQVAAARVAAHDGSVWVFTSTQAVLHLGACLPGQDWAGARAIATHERIAAAARAAGFGVVRESRPRVDDVVASIESIA